MAKVNWSAVSTVAGIITTICSITITAVVLPVAKWGVSTILSHNTRIVAIEATTVPRSEHQVYADAIRAENQLLGSRVARLEQVLATIPTDNPPQWFRDQVTSLASRQTALETRVIAMDKALDDRLDRIERTLDRVADKVATRPPDQEP